MTAGDLMTIGEFSRRCRLPVSTLRYYHQQGLFTPAHVDPATGYRYYRGRQLEMAATVCELRAIGVAPAVIGRITSGAVPLDVALRAERKRLQAEVEQRARAIAGVDALLGRAAAAGVTITTQCRRAVLLPVVYGEMGSETAEWDVVRLIVLLRARLRRARVGVTHFGALLPLDLDTDPVRVTVFAAVDRLGPGCGTTASLPSGAVAVAEHAGDYALGPTYAALLDWIDAKGLDPHGPVVEEYLGTRRTPVTRVSIGVGP